DLHAAADGQRMLDLVRDLVATERFNSFDRFHETTATLTRAYEAAGAQVACDEIATGGRLGSGRWVIHEAADVHAATLAITSPRRRVVADFASNPWHVVQWSAATPTAGVDGELVVLDDGEAVERLRPGELRGRFVLTRLPLRAWLKPLADAGAAVVVGDAGVPGLPDAVPWTKFGWGGLPIEWGPTRLVGFALSARQGEQLRRRHESHGPLTLHAEADIRRYSGTHDVVSGIVVGRDDPQDEVWAMAHSAEPGAVDNASGVASCVEIARVLEALIRRGALPRPRRSIRLISGYECYGFFAYLEQQRRFQPPLAGVNIDSVGLKPAYCDARLQWHATVPMSAGFVDRVGETVLRAAMRLDDAGYRYHHEPFVSTSDTLVGDPKYGFPCPWLTTHRKRSPGYAAYHSSADTTELISQPGLRLGVTAMAAYLHYLADAGNDEMLELADAETGYFSRRLDGVEAPEARYLRDQHGVSLDRLERWMWGGDRSAMLHHLAACRRQVDEAAGRPRPRRSRAAPGGCVPRRTALLTPTLENTPGPIARRIRDTGLPAWALYWADGRRNLAQIAEAVSVEHGRRTSVDEVARFFQAHAELDYVEMVRPDAVIGKRQLVRDLKALGLGADMNVMVHSALSRIGQVEGGADTVVEALLAVLGPSGTLMMPSFNHGAAAVFNVSATPTTNGAIPDALWRRPEAVRSVHPTHAFAAIGPAAERFCADAADGVFAAGSPIGRLIDAGGYLLSLGVTHAASTAMHVAETAVPCGCLAPHGGAEKQVIDRQGPRRMHAMAWRDGQCPVSSRSLDQAMRRRRDQRRGKVGEAACTLVKAERLYRVRMRQLRHVCPTCKIKPRRPRPVT
ncbi:MAG: AAC(3) family N-acetyltransferase, partial [Phycisphaeraceae bacterium]